MLQIRLLGQFDVRLDGKRIVISSRAGQSLLAYLAMTAGTPHRREKLAGTIWPDLSDDVARKNLRQELWRIRKAIPHEGLGETSYYLLSDEYTLTFNPEADYWLDVAMLERPADDIQSLTSSLSLYQGELLPGFYDDWVVFERERIQTLFEARMDELIGKLVDAERWSTVQEQCERWLALGNAPEPAYRALMLSYSARGDMARVSFTYQRCVDDLREQFGVVPSAETLALYNGLLKGTRPSQRFARGEDWPAQSFGEEAQMLWRALGDAPRMNLPAPITSFIGRDREQQEVGDLLKKNRLVTLTGVGGIGKTRLALQIGQSVLNDFPDGVWFIPLDSLSDPALVPKAVAYVLNIEETKNQPLIQTLQNFLRPKTTLLILDNCEHLIHGCALLAEQLLVVCSRLRILATSIEALGLFNETIWQVPSLTLPDMHSSISAEELQKFSSTQLFVERASAVNINFKLTDENAVPVTQICRHLDGIPLAIELAAARTQLLSVSEIAARFDDRFSLLTAGSRTSIPRHQTLRASIDWSYELLTEPERILFRRLAVFAGGFILDAAEQVCSQGELKRSEILDLLGRLAKKSLVIVEQTSAAATRYRLLETIRQYAHEKLINQSGEAPAIRDRHLEYYLALSEKEEALLFSGEQATWVRLLDTELDNVRAAVEWALNTGKTDMVLRITGSLANYWFAHRASASEWLDWIQTALARPEGRKRTLERAKALNAIAGFYFSDVVPTDLRPEMEEALSISREIGDQWNIATALRNLGLMENVNGNYLEARAYLEESLAIWRVLGSDAEFGYAWTLVLLGDVALNCGDEKLARKLYEEVISILRETGNKNFLAYAVRRLGQLLRLQGEYEEATALCKESLDYNREVGSPRGMISCLAEFAAIAVDKRMYPRAAQLLSAVETQMVSMGIPPMYMDRQEYNRNLTRLRTEMDEKNLATLWAKGQEMSLEEALAFALEKG